LRGLLASQPCHRIMHSGLEAAVPAGLAKRARAHRLE
jgi:hypothetical protein